MAKSTGLGLIELSTIFERIKPDLIFSVGDRFETMSTVLAASYMNIPLAHTMGGEVTGTIDESVRHAVTKLSHIHFPATKKFLFKDFKTWRREGKMYFKLDVLELTMLEIQYRKKRI